MEALRWFSVFLFGTLWGSFFFTLAIRFSNDSFNEEKIKALFLPSRCPACGKPIPRLYLIPIAGYLLARGKCRHCRANISPAYPLYEILYGFLAITISLKNGLSIYALIMFLLIGLSIAISVVDVKTLSIPNSLILAFFILSLYPVIMHNMLKDNIYGLLLSFSFFLVILLLFPGSFGGGDIKLASAIGFLLGLEMSIVVIETALITGSMIGVIYAIKTKKGLRIKFPFAPFLTAGLIVSFFYGREIILLYYRLVY
jgi:prepilin signal peptidase PulO-like enzyme (type II secretory pathway)